MESFVEPAGLHGSIESAEGWLKRLKTAGFRIYILSNYGEKPFADSKGRMPFLKHTDGQLISYEIKETKPSPIAFAAVCERFDIDPDKTVFIDDSAVNIATASVSFLPSLGMDFRSARLFKKLKKPGH